MSASGHNRNWDAGTDETVVGLGLDLFWIAKLNPLAVPVNDAQNSLQPLDDGNRREVSEFPFCVLGLRMHRVLTTALEYVALADLGSVAVVDALRDAEGISSLLIGARQN